MTTQERCWIPPRSPTIVGNAVETIVWSSEASNRTSSSALKITRKRGWPFGRDIVEFPVLPLLSVSLMRFRPSADY